jgi:tetratricopeptide (TPR) repeat protein
MKAKAIRSWILSLLWLGTLAPSSQADEAEVRRAENDVREYERRMGRTDSAQLLYLAQVYQENGMRQKAAQTFDRVMAVTAKNARPGEVSDLMVTWATTLMTPPREADKREHQSDVRKAMELLQQAKSMADRLPATNRSRYTARIILINHYRTQGQPNEAEAEESAMLKIMRETTKAITAAGDIATISNAFQQLAESHIAYNPKHTSPAEALRLEALALWDKLPANDAGRIRAHRDMYKWYQRFGNHAGQARETQQLSRMLNTTDRKVLFPEPPPCPACGMG